MKRRRTKRVVSVASVKIGGKNPVSIQSMTKIAASDIDGSVAQLHVLEKAGCEIARLAVKDESDARAIKAIKKSCTIPLVADIHFDWKLALHAMESGVDKVRINPGNIRKPSDIKEVAAAARAHRIPVRVGVNSGSVPRGAQHTSLARVMVDYCMKYVRLMEKAHFHDIVISLKASDITNTVEAYRLIAQSCDYPLHLGLTATGAPALGELKSGIAIGALLMDGIGDTIRVSLTDTPEQEVAAARRILEAVGLRHYGPEIVSCPTCGRCEVDLVSLVRQLDIQLRTTSALAASRIKKIAVMGCVVNGPGEARDADIGVAFGKREGLLFRFGKPVKKIAYGKCVETLMTEVKKD